MTERFDPAANHEKSKQLVGYLPRKEATPQTYADLGFKSGLEIHQQVKTVGKLFCRCPAGRYQRGDDFDSEVVRHMRPTLSELGEYDGTALMEFKTRKNIIYRIKNETACTYEVDDTPPFPVDREAINIAIKIALLLKMSIVGELHITRKQYLDGSIPTGFQRTAIVAIEGNIPLKSKPVRIIQLSVEEDSCREVSDVGHWRIYTTDRLGMPLIETVTYPDMLTPDEVAEAAHYLRFLSRSSGLVRTGIGAAREDVNVSVTGGTRVEIKGVSHICWIPELTHNEGFRQKALLEIRKLLKSRIPDAAKWKMTHAEVDFGQMSLDYLPLYRAKQGMHKLMAVNLPEFRGILSFFTQPCKMFADELSDRLKVIACLERPNMAHSEQIHPVIADADFATLRRLLKAGERDAQILFWGPADDIATAIDTIDERCRLAMTAVPNETRKACEDGTTLFERVLPGPDRMYPDTDSAPIPIDQTLIDTCGQNLPVEVAARMKQMADWGLPVDTHHYLLKRNLLPLIEKVVEQCHQNPVFVGTLLGHTLKHLEGALPAAPDFSYDRVHDLFKFVSKRKLDNEILKSMLPVVYRHPNMDFDSVLITVEYKKQTPDEIIAYVPALKRKFQEIKVSKSPNAEVDWVMGNLRKRACGNISLRELRQRLEKELANG
jgi:glutamyl-tRNA(Gln) amidotransferase subunit E